MRRVDRALRVVLDDEALLDRDRQRHLVTLGLARQRALQLFLVAVEVGGRVGRDLERPRARRRSSWPCRRSRSSAPGLTRALGTLRRLPSSSTWPWETSWRAWRVVSANPSRSTTVSRRVSRRRISSSPVTPVLAVASLVVAAHLALAHAVDRAELLLLHQTGLVLGDALAAAAVLAGRVGSLVRRAVRTAAERLADAPAHAVLGSDLVHGLRVPPAPLGVPAGQGAWAGLPLTVKDVAECDRRAARTRALPVSTEDTS